MNLQPTDYKIVLLRVRSFLNVLFYIESPCFLCLLIHLRISAFSVNKAQIRHFPAIVPYGVHSGHDSNSEPQTERKQPTGLAGFPLLPVGCIASLDVLCVALFPDTVKRTGQRVCCRCICRTDEPGVNVRGGASLCVTKTA